MSEKKTMSPEGKKVFAYLKSHGASTFDELVSGTGLDAQEILQRLNKYTSRKQIKYNPNGKYTVAFVLNPPLKDEPASTKYWNYEKIQSAIQSTNQKGGVQPPAPTSEGVPRKWRSPFLKYLPTRISQGTRGICVGSSTAIGLTLKYFDLTQDFPTPEELANIRRNVEVQLGCPNSMPFIHDIFIKQWKSPQFAYWASREQGHVTVPSGSYLSASVEATKVFGCCFEDDCWTSTSAYCTTEWYPLLPGEFTENAKTRILAKAAEHKTEGYASVTNFDTFCEAIYKKGFGLVPINIYANYTNNGCEGNYPEPAGEVVGSHAQCVVGYDMDARTLEFRQSWGFDWTDEGGISERYWDEAAGTAFVILDEHETKVAEQLYSKVIMNSNVPCNYKVDDESHTVENLSVMLERGVKHTLIATPTNPHQVMEQSQSLDVTPVLDVLNVIFTFKLIAEPKPDPTPGQKSFFVILKEFLDGILAWLTLRQKV